MTKQFEVTAIGNALVDIIARESDEFLTQHNIIKGAMNLIEEPRAKLLLESISTPTYVAGGSAANTIAGFASFGGRGAYIGKVANDDLGDIFATQTTDIGVHYNVPRLMDTVPTGRSTIIVTPDAQRSMNTYLGASNEFNENDVDPELIAQSQIIYMEGYLFDKEPAKKAYLKAARYAHESGGQVALTLSDSFCVDRHRNDFRILVESGTDILFANEREIIELYQTKTLDDAIQAVRGKCDVCVITRSEKGSIILAGEHAFEVTAQPVSSLQDTTGAGDQYAAGFLFGLARGMELPVCGNLASLAASEVISHIGPRPQTSLRALAQSHLNIKLAS